MERDSSGRARKAGATALSVAAWSALAAACGEPGIVAGDGGGQVEFPTGDVSGPDGTGPSFDIAEPDVAGAAPDGSTDGGDLPAGCPGEFSCPCDENQDCFSGLCIEGRDGLLCTKVCETSCPSGFACLNASAAGSDPVSICVPRHVKLCRPCHADADCAETFGGGTSLCLPAADPAEGSFCGSPCAEGVPCPAGHTCDAIPLDGGGEAKQCVPESGLCECRPSWADEGYTTSCTVGGEAGSCAGSRTCGTGGLTACDGAVPLAEVCNGEDDDCNGATDDVAPDPCEVAGDHGTCLGVVACGPGGETLCDASEAFPETCNGQDDDCDGETDEATCDDGLDCTVDSCDPGDGCVHALSPDACLVDGACVEAGASNPADLCETCQPEVSTGSWSDGEGQPCDDGDPCTAGDVCGLGVCKGASYSCQDGLECTEDACDGKGGCVHGLVPNRCLVDGQCFEGFATHPENPCLVCNPALSTSAWSLAPAGKTCDDSQPCTWGDACAAAGICQGTFQPCGDGLPCTEDQCDGKGGCTFSPVDACVIDGKCQSSGAVNPKEPCQSCQPKSSNAAWTSSTGGPCDDGDPCSSSDKCQGGTCKGSASPCTDDKVCTQDACDGNGGCFHNLKAGFCDISGLCKVDGEKNASNPCQVCLAGTSPYAWWNADGAGCSDGDACTSGDTCQGGSCKGSPLLDGFEQNASKASAKAISDTDDCVEWPGQAKSLSATIYPAGDEDWFTFHHADTFGCDFAPTVEVSNLPSGTNYKLCAYYDCDDGTEDVGCTEGTASTSGGKPGCCSDKTGSQAELVRLDVACDCGTFCSDDSGTVHVQVVQKSGAATCQSYTMKWGDD